MIKNLLPELTGTNHQQDSSYIITPHTMDYPVPPSYSEPGGPTVNNVYREDTHNFSRNITSTTRELPTVRKTINSNIMNFSF